MQSLKNERAKKEYEQFVKEVTPKQNLFCNMAKAFIVGGLICVVGQILLHIGKTQFSLSKDDAGSWCSLILILSSVILTGLNIYQKIVTFAGCGALVPLTGFACNGLFHSRRAAVSCRRRKARFSLPAPPGFRLRSAGIFRLF